MKNLKSNIMLLFKNCCENCYPNKKVDSYEIQQNTEKKALIPKIIIEKEEEKGEETKKSHYTTVTETSNQNINQQNKKTNSPQINSLSPNTIDFEESAEIEDIKHECLENGKCIQNLLKSSQFNLANILNQTLASSNSLVSSKNDCLSLANSSSLVSSKNDYFSLVSSSSLVSSRNDYLPLANSSSLALSKNDK